MGQISQLAARLAPFAGEDARAVAEQLVVTYGSAARALAASRESLEFTLASRKGLAETISAARDLADYGALHVLIGDVVNVSNPRFHEYLRRTLQRSDGEELLGIFLDDGGRFIACECLAMGTTDNVAVAARPLVARVLDLGARGLILAHNHPSGDVTPSPSDRATTRRLQSLLNSLDCKLQDHLIVGYDRCYSMARAGEL